MKCTNHIYSPCFFYKSLELVFQYRLDPTRLVYFAPIFVRHVCGWMGRTWLVYFCSLASRIFFSPTFPSFWKLPNDEVDNLLTRQFWRWHSSCPCLKLCPLTNFFVLMKKRVFARVFLSKCSNLQTESDFYKMQTRVIAIAAIAVMIKININILTIIKFPYKS